jgi:hypoxanthine phosphoribosyltransferase
MKKIYYSWQQVEGAVLDIARQINDHGWRPDYIVGIGRGGLVPANLLSQYTGIKMYSLDVSLRDSKDCVSNLGMSEDAYQGEKILIVDDINDQGSTIAWIKKDWQNNCFPGNTSIWDHVWGGNVRFAVLTHNLSSQFKDPDYHVWTVNKAEEDCWLVYPWEEFWL